MEKDQAVQVLGDLRNNDVVVQRGRMRELNEAFKVFWDSQPSIDEFEKVCSGLLLTPRLFYYMVQNPPLPEGKQPAREKPPSMVPAKEPDKKAPAPAVKKK